MISEILTQHTWLWPLAWQSTAILALGLGASFLLRRRSVRAHQLLLLALVATIAVPALSLVVKQHHWGLLTPKPVTVEVRGPALAALDAPDVTGSMSRTETSPATASETATSAPPAAVTARPVKWAKLALPLWIVLSVALLVRLIVRFLLGHRLAQRSEPFDTDTITRAIESAKAKLGIKANVLLHYSRDTRGPVIWCWGVQPVLLVPEGATEGEHIDWPSIACHELAHWKRRDHLSSLWAELVLCALPWNPFAWAAQRRLKRLSEQACDDWVIAAGQVGTRYARTLLSLSAQPQNVLAPGVVTSKRTLAGRIRRIVEDRCSSPHSGRRWSLAAATVAAGLAVTIAFAQTRPAPLPENTSSPEANTVGAADPNEIRLRLIDDEGLPVIGAKAATSVAFREDMLGGTLEWFDEQTSDENGEVLFKTSEVLPSGRDRRGLYILHEGRGLGAVWELSPADAGRSFTVRLDPVCRVRGNVRSPELDSVNMSLRWARAYVYWGDNGILEADPRRKPHLFDFPLPPGEYTVDFDGAGARNHTPTRITAPLRYKRVPVTIPKEQTELDLGTVELEPTGLTELIGKAAPKLGPIKSWKNGEPVTLAQLRGQAVLLHFGGKSPSVSRDLPELVKLHEAFGDKGLTIIAIYNCDSMAELERRWTDTYERRGGAADVPFRVAIDGGESTFYEGSGRERPGATCGRYDITGWPTNVLIDPAGNVLGDLNLHAGEETIRELLGVPPEEPEVLPAPAWRPWFDEVYRLEDGEILRLITPPFIPQRKDYYLSETSKWRSRRPEPPHQFCFHWDSVLQRRMMSFNERTCRLGSLMGDVLGLQDYEFEGPKELLNMELPGDWIVRGDAHREAKLRAMETLLARETGRAIRFMKRPAEHTVVIATGQFEFHAVFDDENVRIFAGESEPSREEEAGTFMDGADSVGEFLERLGPMLGVTMIDQTDKEQETNIPFQVYLRKPLVRTIRDMVEKRRRLESLLANLTAQTELQFEFQTQPAEIWLVTEEEAR